MEQSECFSTVEQMLKTFYMCIWLKLLNQTENKKLSLYIWALYHGPKV